MISQGKLKWLRYLFYVVIISWVATKDLALVGWSMEQNVLHIGSEWFSDTPRLSYAALWIVRWIAVKDLTYRSQASSLKFIIEEGLEEVRISIAPRGLRVALEP